MKNLTACLFVLILSGSLSGQSNWKLEKEKDGIKISTRHVQSSQFSDIRVELDLPGNIEQLAAILLDVNHYKDWSYATKSAMVIKQLGPGRFIYYTEIEVPWPATNRCFYADFDLRKDPSGRSLQVIAVNIPGYGPVSKDLLEVPFTKGVWNISAISTRSIHVDYMLQMNPGGSLPAWVINLFSSKGPLETFENIKAKMTSLNPG